MLYVRGVCTDYWDDAVRLAEEHYDTVDTAPFPRPKLARNLMELIVQANLNLTIWLLDDDRKVRGYANCNISPHMHYGGTLVGMIDAFFVEKLARQEDNSAGRKLLLEMEEALKWRGIEYIQIASGVRHDIGRWLKRKGYSELETIYIKRI